CAREGYDYDGDYW
nr:immunoglobulin heavy chain junction region [Mus musculus]MBK4196610.1 immunoglobulin heavy chain junction region [Mus musculus]MBK4196611.1 immunoglobulin heavy chain junction region [Mus musculus]